MLRTTTPFEIPLGLKIVLNFCFESQISQFQKARRQAGRVVDLKVPNVFHNHLSHPSLNLTVILILTLTLTLVLIFELKLGSRCSAGRVVNIKVSNDILCAPTF